MRATKRTPQLQALLPTLLMALAVALPAVRPAQAQTQTLDPVDAIRAAYARLDYGEAERQARQVLEDYDAFSADELTEVHLLLALITYAQNRPAEARTQFTRALELTPGLTLDPLLVSPKALDFFETVRRDLQQQPTPPSNGGLRYVVVEDPRPAAALRSLVLPGWGQLHKGEKAKGWMMLGAWVSAASGTVLTHLAYRDAHDAYRSEIGSDARIQALYDRSNTRYKLRNGLALAVAGLWAYSYIDALALRPKQGVLARLHLQPGLTTGRPTLQMRWQF